MKQHITTQVHAIGAHQYQLELHVDHDAIVKVLAAKAAASKGGKATAFHGALEVRVVAKPTRAAGAPSLK
jgi:hypothetical protein